MRYAVFICSGEHDLSTQDEATMARYGELCDAMSKRGLLTALDTDVVGVAAANAPATLRSFEQDRVVATEHADTFVDGVACRAPVPDAIDAICKGAARIVQVSEDDAAHAMRLMYDATHNVAEQAGALPLAGLMVDRDAARRRVAVVHSGGNVDAAVLECVLSGRTPRTLSIARAGPSWLSPWRRRLVRRDRLVRWRTGTVGRIAEDAAGLASRR